MCVCFAQFTCFAQTHQQIFPINLPFFRIASNYSLCTKVQIILFAFGNSDRSDQQQLCKLFQANKYYSKFDKCSFVALFAASRISRLWQLFSCLSQDSQLFANSTWDPNSQIWNTKFPVFRPNWRERLQYWITASSFVTNSSFRRFQKLKFYIFISIMEVGNIQSNKFSNKIYNWYKFG